MRHCTVWFALAAVAALGAGCDGSRPTDDGGAADAGGQGDAGASCPSGTEACGGGCVDTDHDRANCGACGTACATGEACIDGACDIVCPASQTECGGACADLTSDRRHCGGCGDACADGEICVDAECEVSCPSGQTVCGGACVDTSSSPAHCGACDSPCAAGQVCMDGTCASTCGALTECSSACVDTSVDPAHCGDCDTACDAAPGASAFCMAGGCRLACDALSGDCNADLGASGGDGCETPLATDPINCGACGRVCTVTNATAGCAAGACTIAMCDTGYGDCNGSLSDGCEADVSTDDYNCGACGTVCPAGASCVGGTCRVVLGDTCGSAVALAPGANTIAWTAFGTDYLTSTPSCVSVGTVTGPDLVLSYTAPITQEVTLEFPKPTDTRWVAVVSTEACGTLSPGLACISDWAPPTMAGTFTLPAGETAYVYVADTTSGTPPLDNPLTVNVTAVDCSGAPTVGSLEPADGTTTMTNGPTFTVTFGGIVVTTAGIISITGDMGTSLTYDLSTSPSQVSFSSSNRVMTIDPGIAFPYGETLTITWSGLTGSACAGTTALPITAPTWVVDIISPSCAPGAGGVVGTTTARVTTGVASFTEIYVAADESPTGYVYFGGTSALWRIPKAGGTVEDADVLAGITSTHLGNAMLIDGSNIYVVNDSSTGTTGKLWRISTDGGASWMVQDYATFPTAPADDFRGITAHGGRIYLVTEEGTSGVTEIWSVDAAAATLPATATLEITVPGEAYCTGIARDDASFYLACEGSGRDRLVRVPAAGGAAFLITDAFPMGLTANHVVGDDLDADGVFDVLYVQLGEEQVLFVCSPAGATPFVGVLADFSGGVSTTTNYGLGFDRTANVLWSIDDDNRDLVSIR